MEMSNNERKAVCTTVQTVQRQERNYYVFWAE
jgi:hypothetical protein